LVIKFRIDFNLCSFWNFVIEWERESLFKTLYSSMQNLHSSVILRNNDVEVKPFFPGLCIPSRLVLEQYLTCKLLNSTEIVRGRCTNRRPILMNSCLGWKNNIKLLFIWRLWKHYFNHDLVKPLISKHIDLLEYEMNVQYWKLSIVQLDVLLHQNLKLIRPIDMLFYWMSLWKDLTW